MISMKMQVTDQEDGSSGQGTLKMYKEQKCSFSKNMEHYCGTLGTVSGR
jgi:hypothetical protein